MHAYFMRTIRRPDVLIVFALVFLYLILQRDSTYITIFQERDLERARMIASGSWLLYGPEVSGGGHLPGALYYYLLALPFWLGWGWSGCWYVMNFFGATAVACAWTFFRKYLSLESAFFGVLFLLSMPQFPKTFAFFQNFSFMPLLLIVALAGFARIFAYEDSRRERTWIVSCLALGLALQLHMSALFIVAAGILMQLLARPLGLRRLNWNPFLLGLCTIALTTVPYYIWWIAYRNGIVIGERPNHYASGFTLTSFQETTGISFNSTGFRRLMKAFGSGWWYDYLLLIPIPAIFLVAALYVLRRKLAPKPFAKGTAEIRAFRVWLICAVFAFIPALNVIYTPHRTRYFTCAVIAFAFLFSGWIELQLSRMKVRPMAILLVCSFAAVLLTSLFEISKHQGLIWQPIWASPWLLVLVFAVSGAAAFILWKPSWSTPVLLLSLFFLGFFSYTGRYNEVFGTKNGVTLGTTEEAASVIVRQTGWSWPEARERLFLVNFHFQRSLSTVYRDRLEKENKTQDRLAQAPDGYFLIVTQGQSSEDQAFKDPKYLKDWLTNLPIPRLIREGVGNGKIALGYPVLVSLAVVVPYTVVDKVTYPPKFQNVGINYLEFHADQAEVAPAAASASSQKTGVDSVRFQFNDCPNRDAFCSIFVDVKKEGKLLHVRLTGDVLSQTSQWVSPNWSQRLLDVFLRLKCNAKAAPVQTTLVDRIGVTIDVTRHRSLTRTLSAPLERFIENPCSGPISEISAGYAQSLVFTTYRDRMKLGGRESSFAGF